MVRLKNPRETRLIDGQGRFDLRPGETVTMSSIPKDVTDLIHRGYLIVLGEKKAVKSDPVENLLPLDETVPQVKESTKRKNEPVKVNAAK